MNTQEIIKQLMVDLYRKYGITKVSEEVFINNELVDEAIRKIRELEQ